MPKPSDRRPSKSQSPRPRPGPPKHVAPPGAGGDRPPPRRPAGPARSGPSRPARPDGPARSGARDEQPLEIGGERFIARGVRLVFEDDDVIVVDKPPGLVTADPSRAQAAAPNMRPSARVGQTLFDFVKRHVRATARPRKRRTPDADPADMPGRVWVIHRLDKEASGLLVFAKSLRAFETLKAEFSTKKAQRVYIAVAEGLVGGGEVGHTGTRQSIINDDRGPHARPLRNAEGVPFTPRPAVTHYKVVGVGNDRTLLHVRLETGRKNQIRIHMLEIGHPLIGDARFNARTNPIGRLALHAAELGFTHPGTRQSVRYASPAPVSFYRAVGVAPPSSSAELEPVRTGSPAPSAPTPAPPASPQETPDREDTSWDSVAQWYDELLEDRGNDHYEQIILPGTLDLLAPAPAQRVLDVACGQGILCRRLMRAGVNVVGVDASAGLIDAARRRTDAMLADAPADARPGAGEFHAMDARGVESLRGTPGFAPFDGATCVMALSNIDPIEPVLSGIAALLKPGGSLVIVLSHPAFRVPGASDWGWDDARALQYRRVEQYLGPFRKSIDMHPGKAAAGMDRRTTSTFHRPLGRYVRALADAGFVVDRLEEWASRREATSGPRAPEENRARLEIPLFLALRVRRSGGQQP